ncbi:MAG TPA: hypothetical protein VMR31_14875 [Myxococcota bacterium]|nr:hypothetical protein [Myxococcota bacterium]
MPTSPTLSPIPLTGADCFLRAFDSEVRRTAGASHLAQLVLRLGPGLDTDALAKLVAEVAEAQPILRAPIRRPLGVLPPAYCVDRAAGAALPRVAVHDIPRAPDGAPPPLFAERLNEIHEARRGQLLRVDAVRYDGGAATDVAFTWLHPLFDGSGSERFLRWLDEVGRGVRSAADLPAGSARPPRADARTRGDLAMRWRARMQASAARAPRSLAGPLARTPQRLEVEVTTFTRAETAAITERARKLAGFLTPMLFYLAASVRAHHAVFQLRGVDPRSFVVPLPANLRDKGVPGDLFGTRVSLLWFQVFPETCAELDALLVELKAQRLALIKDGMVEAGNAAMDYARWLPQRAYAAMARRAFRGELCSFFFGFTDEFLAGMETFLGAPISNGFHAPSVPPSPGSAAIFSVRDGRLNATHVRQAGVFSGFELVRFQKRLRADLLGEPG